MRYQLAPIYCRPWLLNGLSQKLVESHYENNYGGAVRRLNAITEQLESLDVANTPPHVLNGLKRDQLIARAVIGGCVTLERHLPLRAVASRDRASRRAAARAQAHGTAGLAVLPIGAHYHIAAAAERCYPKDIFGAIKPTEMGTADGVIGS